MLKGTGKTIDIFATAHQDPNDPVEDVLKTLLDCVAAGKTRSIGLSECSVQTIKRSYVYLGANPLPALAEQKVG